MNKLRLAQRKRREADDPTALDDEVLVERAQQDPDQFSALYQRYANEIERFVQSRVNDKMLAEDITSMVFTKAMKALPRYSDGPFRAWLYRIARNTIIDEYRRIKPSTSIEDLPLRDSAPSPEDRAIANDAASRLHAALDQLRPTQREIVRMRLHGATIAEIADRMEMSENAVKSAQRRAFLALRDVPGVRS